VRDVLAHPDREAEPVELALFLRGRDHHYVLRPSPFRARDGSPAGLVVALQDVTHLRDQEARREHLIATLSHELRSPLTSLRMALELLSREPELTSGPPAALLSAAQEDVARLADVADRLLDVSRARATSIALERRTVDLATVIPRTLRLFALQAHEKGVTLESAVAGDGLTIVGDATKLTWALSNLLSNALRYTPAGGSVRVGADPDDGRVMLSVSDTGPGIPADQRERIFERFAQASDGGDLGAAGLGLAIVRDIVQAHGGRIHLESEVGRGSRFTLELPRS
jgi:signal transduction histidine kinase